MKDADAAQGPELESRGDPHGQDHALERASQEFEPELEHVVRHAEVAAEAAATRTWLLWAFWLLLGGVLVAGAVHDARFLLLAVLLVTFYALPYVIAAVSTTWGEEERKDLSRSVHEHERRKSAQDDGGHPGVA